MSVPVLLCINCARKSRPPSACVHSSGNFEPFFQKKKNVKFQFFSFFQFLSVSFSFFLFLPVSFSFFLFLSVSFSFFKFLSVSLSLSFIDFY